MVITYRGTRRDETLSLSLLMTEVAIKGGSNFERLGTERLLTDLNFHNPVLLSPYGTG